MNTQIYTTGNDGRQRIFENVKEADYFTWQEYKKTHPDATEQSHIDNNWDVFLRASSDTAKNPLGQTVSQIAKWSGSSPQTQKTLYEIGNNPLGYVAKELAAAAGASPNMQDKLETAGGIAESAVPVWGQARFYLKFIGVAADGKLPSSDNVLSMSQDARSILGTRQQLGSTTSAIPTQKNITQGNTKKPLFSPPQRLEDGRIGYPLSPTRPPKLPGTSQTVAPPHATDSDNRMNLDRRVSQSPSSSQPGSYPNTVGIVNEALYRGRFNLSDSSLSNIKKNMDDVDQGRLTHAQASFRESSGFGKDAINSQLPMKDRVAAATGAALNATLGPTFLAEMDLSNHLQNSSPKNTEIKAVMRGFMVNDPLYNS